MSLHDRIKANPWGRVAATLCVVAITFLSLLPGSWQERTALPGPVEHFIAYSGTGLVLAAVLPRSALVLAALALGVYSGLMELLQNFAPGRDPAVRDFIVSSAGACFGIAIGACIFHRRRSAAP